MSAIVLIGHVNRASAAMELAMKKTKKKTVANDHGREVNSFRSRYKVLPLEYMLRIINDDKLPLELRSQMAAAALPFIHHKLRAIKPDEVERPEQTGLDLSRLTDEELERLEQIQAKAE
jgi:hypothetical protein